MPENWGEKLIISSDFGYVSNILTLPSIICADKRSGGCKISSRYFSKMLSTLRYRTYRPIPSLYDCGLIVVTIFILTFLYFCCHTSVWPVDSRFRPSVPGGFYT